ncbi:LLM class flavin-dependent oxidoreductase [Mycobacterium sp. 94-17]|uniref:LLM class flavin-dependent oxidoreductase n=1 Tax=Mycobacterium sp. 94-17 TaxID=2986147 RepID=UPI002D1ED3C9|nr:LLM class flavin-dependent oxidoreductase [Mycobacterium sp. 94-17]MEB4209756.1 LLM class flavin-dependent oxidoreductase [Mycobacterium sp. 94-17]
MTVRVGMVAPQDGAQVALAEKLGADSLWVGGHVVFPAPTPETMVWLARLVEQTVSVTVGTAVLVLPLYQPAVIAKQIADLDRVCGGRLVLGVGVGGEHPPEFEACQVPLAGRGRRTDEAINVMRHLWSGQPVNHRGEFFSMADIRLNPPPHTPNGPPVVVAGRQPAAMRRAAIIGDGWMPYMYSPRKYAQSAAYIKELAGENDRELTDFTWAVYVPVCVDDDAGAARRSAAAALGGAYNQDFTDLVARVGAAGTVEDVVSRLLEYVDAGVQHIVLMPSRFDEKHTECLLTDVAPRVRG